MTSSAQASFVKNCEDIDELQQVFADVTAASPGRRRRLGAIHKSAIVLLTAFWEAFCEDIAAEALQHLVTRAPDAQALPLELRKQENPAGQTPDSAVTAPFVRGKTAAKRYSYP